jgi:hypothetical protein
VVKSPDKKLIEPLTGARITGQVFRAEVHESLKIGRVTSERCAVRWSKSAENGREKKTLEWKCGGIFVAFENSAGAAGTATQIQNHPAK